MNNALSSLALSLQALPNMFGRKKSKQTEKKRNYILFHNVKLSGNGYDSLQSDFFRQFAIIGKAQVVVNKNNSCSQ